MTKTFVVGGDLFDPPEGTIGLGTFGTIGHGTLGAGRSDGRIPTNVRVGVAEVGGALPPEVVRRSVRRYINQVRECAELHRAGAADIGRLVISFDIGPAGHVTNVTEVESTLNRGRDLSTCVRDIATRWEFPPPQDGGTVHVTYPFLFTELNE